MYNEMHEFLLLAVCAGLAITNILSRIAQARLENRNRLYVAFVKRIPVKNFLTLLGEVGPSTVNSDIGYMLERYFFLALNKIEPKDFPSLLFDIAAHPHSGILNKALTLAAAKNTGAAGMSLARYFDDAKSRSAIEDFLSGLPSNIRQGEYATALNKLAGEYNRNIVSLPPAYREAYEQAMADFKEKISQL